MHHKPLYLGEACLIPIERRVSEKNGNVFYSVHMLIGEK